MAISFGALGAKSAGGTLTISVAYPTGVTAGHIAVAGRSMWDTSTATDETGWVMAADLTGGTGSTVDNHTTRARADTRVLDGAETGSVTFDQAGGLNGCIGVMARYASDVSGATWSVVGATGDDATHGADRSATASTSISLGPGDMLVAVVATDTDTALAGFASPAFTASGITFDTTNRRTSGAGVTTGADGNIELFDALVSSGSGTVAPTLAFTTTTSQCGPVAFVRLREIVPALPPRALIVDQAVHRSYSY